MYMQLNTKKIILSYLSEGIKEIINEIDEKSFELIEEIRVRVNKPIIIKTKEKEKVFLYKPTPHEISKILELISNYSLYAFEEELKNGYITLTGGHRVGITGRAVLENGVVKTIKNINGFNIRISHEVKGCGNKVLPYIVNGEVKHTIIISPPCCGKTTLLRDLARQISNGVDGIVKGQAVSIVDERSEIAGCYMGIPQNDVGIRTDILDGCPKDYGMLLLLRSMAPKVIIVDEIGRHSDIHAIDSIINAGVKVICSVHGDSIDDILKKPVLSEFVNKNILERFVVLKKNFERDIYNENFEKIVSI